MEDSSWDSIILMLVEADDIDDDWFVGGFGVWIRDDPFVWRLFIVINQCDKYFCLC